MAIQYNENIKIAAPNPLDKRYLSNRTFGGRQLPYSGVTEVNTTIISSERYTGLTVNVNNSEYWYKNGIADIYLVEKKSGSEIPADDFVTGATNIGFFTGNTGVQILPITSLTSTGYTGNYYSLYNNYYRGTDGKIHLGKSITAPNLRAYVKTTLPVKSWIYNEYVGGGNLTGWIYINGNVEDYIGTYVGGKSYYNGITTQPYTVFGWTEGVSYSNGSNAVIGTVLGNLTTGSTITVGGASYINKTNNILNLRTIKSKTTNLVKVSQDEAFIYLSGATVAGSGRNVGSGAGIYTGITGTTLLFKSLVGSGGTTLYQRNDRIIISSSGGSGGGTYNLTSPAAITVGGINSGTVLTGKTSFQLFEALLVPVLYPTLISPSNSFAKISPSGTLFEIGQVSSINFFASFNRGSITPAYGTSGYRSGLPSTYTYTGTGLPSTVSSSSLTDNQTSSSYIITIGNQSWTNTITHLVGEQPKDSKGNNYSTSYSAGTTGAQTVTIEGVYPLFGTTATITSLTKQTLVSMLTGNNISMTLIAETGGNKQKFEISNAWVGSPTNRALVGVQQYNTVSGQWEYPGGTAGTSLSLWSTSSVTETVQGNSIGYTRYTYNGVDRSSVQIRLVF